MNPKDAQFIKDLSVLIVEEVMTTPSMKDFFNQKAFNTPGPIFNSKEVITNTLRNVISEAVEATVKKMVF